MLKTQKSELAKSPVDGEEHDPLKGWFDVREVGWITSVKEFIVKVKGLPSCMNGQVVEFSTGDKGMVMGFTRSMFWYSSLATNQRFGPDKRSILAGRSPSSFRWESRSSDGSSAP